MTRKVTKAGGLPEAGAPAEARAGDTLVFTLMGDRRLRPRGVLSLAEGLAHLPGGAHVLAQSPIGVARHSQHEGP